LPAVSGSSEAGAGQAHGRCPRVDPKGNVSQHQPE
jgi:hypothetical protein